MYLIAVSVTLALFWALLSGHFTPLFIFFGGLSVAISVVFTLRMNKVDGLPTFLLPTPRLLGYIAWLMGEVVKSNIDLVRRIWNPSLPITPTWTRLDTQVDTPMQRTLYANSITLTPGTLTTDVYDDHFVVHALSTEGIEDLRRGNMESRIRKLEI